MKAEEEFGLHNRATTAHCERGRPAKRRGGCLLSTYEGRGRLHCCIGNLGQRRKGREKVNLEKRESHRGGKEWERFLPFSTSVKIRS